MKNIRGGLIKIANAKLVWNMVNVAWHIFYFLLVINLTFSRTALVSLMRSSAGFFTYNYCSNAEMVAAY